MHIVHEQVAAYNARDVERFLATYHPDTVITLANGTEMMRGHDAMRALYGQLFAQSHHLRCEVPESMDLGRFVVLREIVTGMQLDGFPESLDIGVVYTVDDGLITHVQFLM